MERLKTFCKKAFSYPELLHSTHPLTTILITATTVLFAVYTFILSMMNYNSGYGMDIFLSICLSFMFFSVFVLMSESIRARESAAVKAVVLAVYAALSLLMGFIFFDDSKRARSGFLALIGDLKTRLGITTVMTYVFALLLIALILALYFAYSHDILQSFADHMINSYSKIFMTSIIYGVVQLGVVFLTVIVSLLLYDDAFNYLPTVLVLINGLFYVPAVVYALTHENERANIFVQVIVRYVSLVITVLGFVIIYIYIIKLIVTASVPSNSVYGILTALFIVSMFISYMCTSFEESGFLQKFAYNCPLIFAPFILMQCYTIFVRIGQYGLSPKRYLGIAFILFEIAYIVYYAVSRKIYHEIAGRNILLILCAFLIIGIFVPGINAFRLSTSFAKRRLSSYLEKTAAGTTISDKEYILANAAYDLLSDDSLGAGKLIKYFSGIDEDTKTELRERSMLAKKKANDQNENDDDDYDNMIYAWYNTDLSEVEGSKDIDIDGYRKLIPVRISGNDPVDLCKLSVYYYENGYEENGVSVKELPEADLEDFVTAMMNLYEQYDSDVMDSDEYTSAVAGKAKIDISDDLRLYITSTDVDINADGKAVSVNMEGYLLVK